MEASTPQNSSPLGALLSDPALMSTVKALAANLSASQSATSAPSPNDTSDTSPRGLDGLLSMLSDPALIQHLTPLISPLMQSIGGAQEQKRDSAEEGALSAGAPPSPPPHHSHEEKMRNDLLLSLKPFLSKERCEAIDMIIKLSALGSILGKIR